MVSYQKHDTTVTHFRTSETIEGNCQIENHPMTYQIILVMGTTFCLIYAFVALNINRLGKKILFRKFEIVHPEVCAVF